MHNISTVTILVFVMIFTSLANAEEFVEKYRTSSKYDACIQNVMSTYAILSCMQDELKLQDNLLNKNYKKAIKLLKEDRKRKLISAQRAWINYRDQKCSLYYHERSGSGGLLDEVDCLIKETIKRSTELSEIVE